MRTQLVFLVLFCVSSAKAQYPFEQLPHPAYSEYSDYKTYDWSDTKGTLNYTFTVNQFFSNEDSLTVQFTSFTEKPDSTSVIRIFRNKAQIQLITDSTYFWILNTATFPLLVADVNGDGRNDLKIVIPSVGNGLAALNVSVIYLFQNKNNLFEKISFTDKMENYRMERDFDGDGNHEIITMGLNSYGGHSYWNFNIFEFENGGLTNANFKGDYPIMVQYLFHENFEITKKLSRKEMKSFSMDFPKNYSFAE